VLYILVFGSDLKLSDVETKCKASGDISETSFQTKALNAFELVQLDQGCHRKHIVIRDPGIASSRYTPQ